MTFALDQALTAEIEALSVTGDPQQRDRHLLRAAALASGAAGVALWRLIGGAWVHLAGCGPLEDAPTAAQIEGVVAGQLPPILPPGLLISHLGQEALTTCGLPVGVDPEDLLDSLDALLLTAALSGGSALGEQLSEHLLPALPAKEDCRGSYPDAMASSAHLFAGPDPRPKSNLAAALEALSETPPVTFRSSQEGEGAATLPLEMPHEVLQATLNLLIHLDTGAGPLTLSADLRRAGRQLLIRARRTGWSRRLPRGAGLAELEAHCSGQGLELSILGSSLLLRLPIAGDYPTNGSV